jgi:hypothetical protein
MVVCRPIPKPFQKKNFHIFAAVSLISFMTVSRSRCHIVYYARWTARPSPSLKTKPLQALTSPPRQPEHGSIYPTVAPSSSVRDILATSTTRLMFGKRRVTYSGHLMTPYWREGGLTMTPTNSKIHSTTRRDLGGILLHLMFYV